MAFTSPLFLFFFLPVVLLLFRLQRCEMTNFFLLLVSLFFYAWGKGPYVLVLLLAITGNYLLGRVIGVSVANTSGGRWFALGLLFNIGLLVFFKYLPVFFPSLAIHLPIGISFFTFQALSYLIAVRRGVIPGQKNLLHVGLVMALFP